MPTPELDRSISMASAHVEPTSPHHSHVLVCVLVLCRSRVDAATLRARTDSDALGMAAAADHPDLERITPQRSVTADDRSNIDLRGSDDGGDPVRGCGRPLQHSTLAANAYCTLGCGRRIIGTKGSRPSGNGRAHITCIDRAAPRQARDKERKLRAPSPPASPREPSRRRRNDVDAAAAMASLSGVVAEFQHSDSHSTVESESASTSAIDQPVAAPATAAAASISREFIEDSSEALPHSKHSAPLSSMELLAHPERMMKLYGFALLAPTVESKAMADRISKIDLEALKRGDSSHRHSVISGDVEQVDLRQASSVFSRADQTAWDEVTLEAFRRCGLEEETKLLHRVATKVLDAKPGNGEQTVHFDSADGWSATDSFSVILVCAKGTDTTALPRFCAAAEFPWARDDTVPTRDLQRVCHLLEAEWYHRVRAGMGAILVFRESVPHHGTRNPKSSGNRRVLFSMWSPRKESDQDEYQLYPWMVIAQAYGVSSVETAEALVKYAEHSPIQRMDQNTRIQYEDCLRKHRLLTKYRSSLPNTDAHQV